MQKLSRWGDFNVRNIPQLEKDSGSGSHCVCSSQIHFKTYAGKKKVENGKLKTENFDLEKSGII
jgi:hypothetical protein